MKETITIGVALGDKDHMARVTNTKAGGAKFFKLYPESTVAIEAGAHADLALVNSRDGLVSSRTRLINHSRGVVKLLESDFPVVAAQVLPNAAPSMCPIS